jgi:AcrR family transcriptional regulator
MRERMEFSHMQNVILTRAVERSLAERRAATESEIRRLVDAAFAVMRRADGVDPRVSDIVREAGLSNQAFYRHFRSKDELLVAVMEEGRQRLLSSLERRMADAPDPVGAVRAWIEGVMAQAEHPRAAEATRPFAVDAARLAHRFPEETAASAAALQAPLAAALAAAGSPDPARDAEAVYHLAVGRMERHLVVGTRPSAADVGHLVDVALHGVLRTGH